MSALKKILCLTLALSALLFLSSCEKDDGENDPKIRIEIKDEPITYGDAFLEDAELRYTAVATAMLESYYGAELKPEQQERVGAAFESKILPLLYRVKINEAELLGILTSLEQRQSGVGDTSLLSAIYDSCLYSVGEQRCGRLAYGIAHLLLEENIRTASDRYEKYGYSWYLDDVERCTSLSESLTAMGEERFSEAAAVFSQVTALGASLESSQSTGLFLTDSELLYILDYRARGFTKSNITQDEWSIIGALTSEFIPVKADTLKSAMLYEFKKDSYPEVAMRAFPSLINLYASLTKEIKNVEGFGFGIDRDRQAKAIATALLASEDELSALSADLIAYAKTESSSQERVVKSHFTEEEILSFIESHPAIDYATLVAGLGEIANSDGARAYERLTELFLSYLYGIAPYATLALSLGSI